MINMKDCGLQKIAETSAEFEILNKKLVVQKIIFTTKECEEILAEIK